MADTASPTSGTALSLVPPPPPQASSDTATVSDHRLSTLTYYVVPFSKGWRPERRKLVVPDSIDATAIAKAVYESYLSTGAPPEEICVSGGRIVGDIVFLWSDGQVIQYPSAI